MKIKKINLTVKLLLIIISLTQFQIATAQVRSGLGFLKMIPGSRVQSMAASFTGGLDEPHAFYANPGAVGLLREWQWSANYTKWIADVYNASFIYGRYIRTPWSHKTKLALGMLYYGVPRFDSSDHAVADASANDVVFSLSVGQPLSFLSNNVSVGSNIKYYKSTLANYTANSLIFDFGIMGRSPRFSLKNSFLEYGILSVGASINQLGKNVVFDMVGTPLPRTLSVGAGFYAGSHHGLQVQFLMDYKKVRDEKSVLGFGAEMSWSKRFSLNGGYNFDNDLMEHVSFGASIRLDDINTSDQIMLPGRNNALQVDIATLDESEFFNRTYRGSATHFPLRPEYFEFVSPAMDDSLYKADNINLLWEQATDPDLFDKVKYQLLFDSDSVRIARLLETYDRNGKTAFFQALAVDSLQITAEMKGNSYLIDRLSSGDYYWSVCAIDLDEHLRFAKKDGQRIAHFLVPYADIEIQDIQFEHSPWITQDDYHGELKVTLANTGQIEVNNFDLDIYDEIAKLHKCSPRADDLSKKLLTKKLVETIKLGETKIVELPWHTKLLGSHNITARVDIKQEVLENNTANNQLSKIFYTIPKGTFATADTAAAVLISQVSLDMPIITEVCFPKRSSKVTREYLHKITFDAPLAVLAQRLRGARHLSISLKGFADPNSGETSVKLADMRAMAVKDSMIKLGVAASQIEILAGEVLPKRRVPANPTDAKWVFEERRHVKIFSDEAGQAVLFQPVRFIDNEEIPQNIKFDSKIKYVLPMLKTDVTFANRSVQENLPVTKLNNVEDVVEWNPHNKNNGYWINKNVDYSIAVVDSLNRTFRTHDKLTYLDNRIHQREHRFAFPLKFAQTDPVYNFYWSQLLDLTRTFLGDIEKNMEFSGHACAVGPDYVNKRLSKQRANRFHSGFVNYVKENDSAYYNKIMEKIAPAKGMGEDEPMAIKRLSGKTILIGDNNMALGRKLNRRIEVKFSIDILKNVREELYTN